MVLVNDRKKEIRFCILCKNNYDQKEFRPECLIPCGHTFCHKCLKAVKNSCPKCSLYFNQIIPDYEMMDIVGVDFNCDKDKKSVKNSNLIEIITQESENVTVDSNFNHLNKLKPEFVHLIVEGTKEQQLIGVSEVRKLLSKETNPPIDEIINSGLVPKLTELLTSSDCSIQFECVWALTNIASGDSLQTQTVIKAGAIPNFISLLNSKSEEIKEQSIWALGNIAGDGAESRDLVLEHGIMGPLLEILNNDTIKSLSFIKNSVWCLSNLFRFKPSVDFEKVKNAMPILNRYLVECSDTEILTDVLWGLSYLSDGSTSQIQSFLDHINMKNVVNKLSHESFKVITPTLRIIGNIASGNDEQTQVILDLGILQNLKDCLETYKTNTQKEICWTISNMTAGNINQIQQVIDSGIMKKIIELIGSGVSLNVKREALWAVSNAFSGGTKDQMIYLINLGVLEVLDKQLSCYLENDITIEDLCLSVFEIVGQSLENVLKVSIENLDLPDSLHSLKNSSNISVAQKALKLLEKFSTRSSGSYEGEELIDNEFDDNQDVIS